ncbi:ATP-grasp ribosomal peptide maturase [Streptosporangium sp. NPDC049644]|uniref:ATP-grasp ribosomal peptide maturase n=1 Tax=Streptosporangium sp. NPDC049644 TaxID=3155507 RepID=UPI00341FE437
MRPSPQTVLVVTSAEDITANLVIEVLNERQVQIVRADPGDIGAELVFSAYIGDDRRKEWAGRLRTPSRDIALEEVGAVYYRRPTPFSARFAHLPALDRKFAAVEAQHGLNGILNHLHGAVYVNHPAANNRSDYKPYQLQTAAQLGLTVPLTLITNDVEQARKFAAEHGPIIYKSFRGAPRTLDGHVAAIWTQRIDPEDLDDSVSVTAHLFQQEVRKTADARVTVIGKSVFASRITAPDDALDWRSGDWEQLTHDPIDVPEPIRHALRAYLDHFGLVFGCFDFALEAVSGRRSESWTFIECNPNGQWAWLPDATAMAHAFADVLLEGWWP